MRIRVSRTGGFAGVEEDLGTIVTEALPDEDAARAVAAVSELAARGTSAAEVGADFFTYRVAAADHTTLDFEISDPGDPDGPSDPALAELLRLLRPGG